MSFSPRDAMQLRYMLWPCVHPSRGVSEICKTGKWRTGNWRTVVEMNDKWWVCLTLCWLAYLHPANGLSIALNWVTVCQRWRFSCPALSSPDINNLLDNGLPYGIGQAIIFLPCGSFYRLSSSLYRLEHGAECTAWVKTSLPCVSQLCETPTLPSTGS